MAAQQGFRAINNEPFVYQENSTGVSSALGIDSTGILSISIATTAGSSPSAAGQLVIDSAVAGNITLNPNGILLITKATEMVGNLKIDTLTAGVMQTNATGNVTSSNGSSGQLLIGGGAAPVWANLTSIGASVTITNGANSINLEASGTGTLTQLDGNTGSALPFAGTINVNGNNLIRTSASGNTVVINVEGGTDGQVIIASTAGLPDFANLTSTGGSITYTTGANTLSLDGTPATTTQLGMVTLATNAETIAGANTTKAVTPDDLKAKLGLQTIHGVLVGGSQTGAVAVTAAGSTNTVLLGNTGADPFFGTVPNAALVNSAITLNNGNNITVTGSPVSLGGAATINVSGTTNHAVQVGNASNSLTSIPVATNGQVLVGSTGLDPVFATLTTNSAANIVYVTGAGTLQINLAESILLPATTGASAGVIALGTSRTTNRFLHGYGTQNVFLGEQAGNFTLTSTQNVCVGYQAGNALSTTPGHNTYIGFQAGLLDDGSGGTNVAVGHLSLSSFTGTTTARNVAIGGSSLASITTGKRNVGLGYESGITYTTETDNISIGYQVNGTAAENNVLRIGNGTGTSNGNLDKTFIHGISGRTIASSATVIINTSTGQMGTVVSSLRYKKNVKPIEDESIMNLEPVSFVYREDPEELHFGFIAEQVEDVFPALITYDKENQPETIKYHEFAPLLLAEIKRLAERIAMLERTINGQ